MTTIGEDILTYLESGRYGVRHRTLFTSAEQGAFDNRPLSLVVTEARSPDTPDVTVDADVSYVNLVISGQYGKQGESHVYAYADKVYRYMRLVLDQTINQTTYLCIEALNPPAHAGYDENGRTVYEITLEIYRVLTEA